MSIHRWFCVNGSPFLHEKKPVCSKEANVWYGIVTKKRLFVVAFRVPKRENRETRRGGREVGTYVGVK